MPETIRIATEEIGKAADILKRGGIVAFPTETVFGLGAIAFDQTAVHRVFQAKGRPNDNPLIAHIADLDQLKLLASDVPVLAMGLMERFWPGCLTIILPKQPSVPDSVTAGLETVAVRMPSDPLALELIRKAGAPIVAPSANRSGRPSATTWQDVLKDLDGRIDGVVCGPPTSVGLESTVVDATGNWPHVLRHGGIPEADIAQVALEIGLSKPLQDTPQKELSHRSPGTKHRHYQPSAQVVLVNDFNDFLGRSASQRGLGQRVGWIGLSGGQTSGIRGQVKPIEMAEGKLFFCDRLEQYASHLYRFFRDCDAEGIRTIYCDRVPNDGIGRAINDRIQRASDS